MNKIDTVLFGFDGTGMDTNNVIRMSWQHTFRTLRGREEDREVIVKTFGEPLELTMKKFFPEVPAEEALEVYRSFHRDNFGELINLFPGMRELLAELGSSQETSIMLGDTLFDLLCAKNAGVRSVLVSWSLALHGMTKEDLGEAAPDYIIQKPEELLEIIA